MKKSSIFASILMLVSVIFLYACSNSSVQEISPKKEAKTGNDFVLSQSTNSAGNLIIATETPEGIALNFSQQEMRTAIMKAYSNAKGETVTADSLAYIVDNVNPETKETEYALILPIRKNNGGREYIGTEVIKTDYEFELTSREVSCSGIDCDCSLSWWGRCGCPAGTCYKVIRRTKLSANFTSELSY